jgi:transcriptional regulator with XRE-family HTH domain
MDERNLSDADFGALIERTRQAVHRYRTGERVPDQTTLEKIFEVTGGAVTPNDFFGLTQPSAQSSKALTS